MNRRFVAGTSVVAVLLAAGAAQTVTGSDSDTVVATFADASPLEQGSQVRAAGVRVGTVESIELLDDVARVELNLDSSVTPVHRDAQLTVRPVNLLGETYVDLETGSPDEPYLTGPLPVDQTSSSVTLQDVLNTFDDPTSAGLAALVTTLGQGMDENGQQVAAAIKALEPTMRDAQRLGDILDDQNEVLGSLVDQASPVAAALASEEGEDLDELIEATTRTLTTLAEQQEGMKATIEELPSTLAAATSALDRVTATSREATPTLRDARSVTGQLPELTGEISDFSEAADPAMRSLDPVLEKADVLLADAAPLVRQLTESGDDLVKASRTLDDVGQILVDDHLEDLMAFVRQWALSTNGRDGLSHYFRGVLHVSPEALNTLIGMDLLPDLGTTDLLPNLDGSSPSNGPRDTASDDPLVGEISSVLDDLGLISKRSEDDDADPTTPSNPKSSGPSASSKASPSPSADPSNATGLEPEQEKSLIEQLLGGTS